jgi:CspA family cold shock protein
MSTGTVKWFSIDKGYGFIQPSAPTDTSEDVFVHVVDLEDSGIDLLRSGDVVSYEIGKNSHNQKPKAVRLKLI